MSKVKWFVIAALMAPLAANAGIIAQSGTAGPGPFSGQFASIGVDATSATSITGIGVFVGQGSWDPCNGGAFPGDCLRVIIPGYFDSGLIDVAVAPGSTIIGPQNLGALLGTVFSIDLYAIITGPDETLDWAVAVYGDGAVAVAVPEPGSLGLIALGLIGLGLSRRYRRA